MAKITIFGLAGAGKSSVGKLLAKKLGADFISSGNLYREEAKSRGLTLSEFEVFCLKDDSLDRALDNKMKEYGCTHDHFVAESRLAWFFISDSIKIKLDCDFNTRVGRVVSRDQVSLEHALKETNLREAAHLERFRQYYGISRYDADENFDHIIDTTHSCPEDVVEKICDIISTYEHR